MTCEQVERLRILENQNEFLIKENANLKAELTLTRNALKNCNNEINAYREHSGYTKKAQ